MQNARKKREKKYCSTVCIKYVEKYSLIGEQLQIEYSFMKTLEKKIDSNVDNI